MRTLAPTLCCFLPLLWAGCDGGGCADQPLTAEPEGAWIVRWNADVAVVDIEPPVPGVELYLDPPGMGEFATFALHDADGSVVNSRWLSTGAAVGGVGVTVDAATQLPWATPPGRVTALTAGGRRAALSFSLSSGAPTGPAFAWPTTPESAGQLVDTAPMADGVVLASRRRIEGDGGDVMVFDEAGGQLRIIALDALEQGRVEPGRLARLNEREAMVGLNFGDNVQGGAVAIVDVGGGVRRVDVPNFEGCGDVTPLEPDPARPTVARVAILCTGDLTAPPGSRDTAGLWLAEVSVGSPPLFVRQTPGNSAGVAPPSRGLVGLRGTWVAATSVGDPSAGRSDALLAIDLSTGDAVVLRQDPWLGGVPSHGSGDFGGGELWWPVASLGVSRWRVEGDELLTFSELALAPRPSCASGQPRVVRHLDVSAAPLVDAGPPPDAGPEADAGPEVDAGPPADAGAEVDAGPMDAG